MERHRFLAGLVSHVWVEAVESAFVEVFASSDKRVGELTMVACPGREGLLNERSEVISKCRHIKEYILGL